MTLRDEIIDLAHSLGACDAGFFEDKSTELGFGISVAVCLSNTIVDEIETEPTLTYFNHYRSVNALIDHIILRIGVLVQQRGFKYITVAASQSMPHLGKFKGRYSHKRAAVRSGMGYVGHNGLFLHEAHGPRVRLGTILCDFDGTDIPRIAEGQDCIKCRKCVRACPAQALYGEDFDINDSDKPLLDYAACSEHMKKKYQHIGRGAVCGICMRVCPVGQ